MAYTLLGTTRLTPALALARCPHCLIANPSLIIQDNRITLRSDGQTPQTWATFACTTCGSFTVARCETVSGQSAIIHEIFPEPKVAHEDIPDSARKYLQQAIDTLYAPDASAVMAGSAVDSMLKQLGYTSGSVYVRIEQAVSDAKLTKEMGEWAHQVRLGANRPRHADAENPHVSAQEAQQAVEFAQALGQFLFVLSARVKRGLAAAEGVSIRPPSTS